MKDKILTLLHAAYLTHKHEFRNAGRRGNVIAGQHLSALAETLSMPIEEINAGLKELIAEGLVKKRKEDDYFTLTGLAIQRLDFKERIEQMKSEVYISMVATIIETNLKGVDPSDKKTWTEKALEAARVIVTKGVEIAMEVAIKGNIG